MAIIAVDFDGTIVEHAFPKIGKPVPYALEWLRKWQNNGHKLILWTMRSHGQSDEMVLKDAIAYLRDNGIELYGINGNPDQRKWTESPKAYAQIYIDDAAACCPVIPATEVDAPMVDWSKVGPRVDFMISRMERAD